MPLTLKTTELQYKDSHNVYHGINAVAEKPTADVIADLDAAIEERQDTVDGILDAQETRGTQITSAAQSAVDGIEGQKNTMIASIASVAGMGTDTTLTQSGVAADAKVTGDKISEIKSALKTDVFPQTGEEDTVTWTGIGSKLTNLYLEAGNTYLIKNATPENQTSASGTLFIDGYVDEYSVSFPNVGKYVEFTPLHSGYLKMYTGLSGNYTATIRVMGRVDLIENNLIALENEMTGITETLSWTAAGSKLTKIYATAGKNYIIKNDTPDNVECAYGPVYIDGHINDYAINFPDKGETAGFKPLHSGYIRMYTGLSGNHSATIKVLGSIDALQNNIKGIENHIADYFNFCDFYSFNSGKKLNIYTGKLEDESEKSYSDFFTVKPGRTYCIASWNGSQYAQLGAEYNICYYDINQNYMSGEIVDSSSSSNAPEQAAFARISINGGLITASRQLMFIEHADLSSLTDTGKFVPNRNSIKTLETFNQIEEKYAIVRNPYCELEYPNMYARFDGIVFYYNGIIRTAEFNYSDFISRYPDNYTAYNNAKVHQLVAVDSTNSIIVLTKSTMKVDIISKSYLKTDTDDYILLCYYDAASEQMKGLIPEQYALVNERNFNKSRYEKLSISFLTALNNRLNAISSLLTDENFTFAWVSDNHMPGTIGTEEADETNMAIGYADKSVNFDAIINTGDSVMERSDVPAMNALRKIGEKINTDKLVYCEGNHDRSTVAPLVSKEAFYNLVYRQTKDENIHWGSKLDAYYYRDFPAHKIRIIVLNVYEFFFDMNNNAVDSTKVGYSNSQLEWLANTALVVENDWHVIICTHDAPVPLEYNTASIQHNKQSLIDILQSYKNGTSVIVTYTDASYPELFNVNVQTHFSHNGSIVAVLSGHAHYDDADVVDGINYIQLNCGYIDVSNAFSGYRERTMFEYSGCLFDIGIINKATRTLTLKRVGYGTDRNFTF